MEMEMEMGMEMEMEMGMEMEMEMEMEMGWGMRMLAKMYFLGIVAALHRSLQLHVVRECSFPWCRLLL